MSTYFTIISSSPTYGEKNVDTNASIKLITSVQLDPSTVNYGSVVLSNKDGVRLQGTLSYINHSNGAYGIIYFSPASELIALSNYTINITTKVRGINDETLEALERIRFSTGRNSTKILKTADHVSFIKSACYANDASYWTSKKLMVPSANGIIHKNVSQIIGDQYWTIYTIFNNKAGSIVPSDQSVKDGYSQTVSIIPMDGYEIENVFIDNLEIGPISSYTFSNIIENHVVKASFIESGNLYIENIRVFDSDTPIVENITDSQNSVWNWTAEVKNTEEDVQSWAVAWDGDPEKLTWGSNGNIISIHYTDKFMQDQELHITARMGDYSLNGILQLKFDSQYYYYNASGEEEEVPK